MRLLTAAMVSVVSLLWAGWAVAGEIPTNKRVVEFRVVEPCDFEVLSGEVVLEWSDSGGAYNLVSMDYENYPHPISVLFYVGAPDFSDIDPHVYSSFFCRKATTRRPDVYCMDCSPCDWYLYQTWADWCGERVCVLAYLPCCMALDITDAY